MRGREFHGVVTALTVGVLVANVITNGSRSAAVLGAMGDRYARTVRRIIGRPRGRDRVSDRRGAITYATRARRMRARCEQLELALGPFGAQVIELARG